MDNQNLERDVRRARSEYLAALHRLALAMTAFQRRPRALHPDGHRRLEAWTRDPRRRDEGLRVGAARGRRDPPEV